MHDRRSYQQFCGLASALDVLGERWTLLIVRELLLGPRRFGELAEALEGMGPNLLSDRLRSLLAADVIERSAVEDDARGTRYRLTEHGHELRESVLLLARWGMHHVKPEHEAAMRRPAWAFLAVQAMIMGRSAPADVDERYEFRVDGDPFHIDVSGGAVVARVGPAREPAIVMTTDSATFVRIGADLTTPFEAVVSGSLVLEGDMAAVGRCTRLMGLVDVTLRAHV